jgi:hypothetical protein
MGLGRYQNGAFHLVASFRYPADQTEVALWRASISHASRLLFDATDGQHRIGTLTFCNDSTAGGVADLWLEQPVGQSVSDHGGIGRPGFFAQLRGDQLAPFIVLHELGHILYHLHDEYQGNGCVGGTTADACVMEGAQDEGDQIEAGTGAILPGRIRRFCVAGNHDPDGNTNQHGAHQQSCWQTMAEMPFDLVVPDGLPVGADPDGIAPPAFLELATVPRLVTVLDRSGSMTGVKLEQAKIGATFLVDLGRDGEELAQVSFASAATVDLPRHPLTGDRDAERFAVENLTADGQTSIGDGLRTALDELSSAPLRSSVQSVVLISDGLQTSGEDPSTVLPDLVRTLTRVYVAAVGPEVDGELLSEVAAGTGGQFVRIDPDADAGDQAFALRSAMEQFALLARDGGAVTGSSAERLADGEQITRASIVEPGARTATFVASWPRAKDRAELELVGPSGQVLSTDTTGAGLRVVAPDRPYVAYEVSAPEPGRWRLRLTARSEQGPVDLLRWTAVENPDLVGALHLPRGRVVPGERVRATFTLAYGRRLTGLRLGARLVGPDGARPVRFRAGRADTESEGEYTASFRAPQKEGAYALELTARNDPRRTRGAALEGVDEQVPTPPVPSFARRYAGTLVVG